MSNSNFYNLWILLKIFGYKGYYFINTYFKGITNEVDRKKENSINIYNHLNELCSDPNYIIDNIYLGSSYNSSNSNILKKFSIEKIINVTQEIPCEFDTIDYLRIPIRDTRDNFIETYLEESYQFIINNYKHQILIHCYMGSSRSATIVLYYLMKKHKMKLNDALLFLNKKRPLVNINLNFLRELTNIEKRKDLNISQNIY